MTLFDESLQYTIRFQNNGNDTAFAVTIVDELDPAIIPTSIRVLSSSHDVATHIRGQLLTFTFPGIELVDSMTNYAGSQGYVSFACQTVDGVNELTAIENTANIIFDTNPPIVTNTVTSTMVSKLCSDIEVSETVTICAGDSYLGFTEAGDYIETTSIGTEGCDSVYMLELIVIAPENEAVTIGLCPGEIALFNGVTYSQPGIYQDSLLLEGCVVTIYDIGVTEIEQISMTIDTTICPGGAVFGFEETGTYSITLTNSEGCDTLVDLSLTLLPADDPMCAVAVVDGSAATLRLVPNPVTNLVIVEADRPMAEVTLYQPDGVLVVQDKSVQSTELSISLEHHASGVYILVVRYDDGSLLARRLVKM